VVQRLVVDRTEPGGHRLDRLAAAVQQQPAQVALPAGALISTWQRREQVVGEGFQASTDRGQLGWCEASHSFPLCAQIGGNESFTSYPSAADLTESY
jgi:hypothetical protein